MASTNRLPFAASRLHPVFRAKVERLMEQFESEEIPFRPLEGFRAPVRQDWLFQKGRTRPGAVVTKARAWESYHQYGLAVDFVLFENGAWSWNVTGGRMKKWNRMIALGKAQGLEPLSFELPHLQLAGLKISQLKNGVVPPGGDKSWWDGIEAAASEWSGSPASPAFVRG